MKKFLSLMLTVILILSLVPTTTVFAAKESFIKITEVTVNEVPSPAAATEVQFSANCTTKYVSVNSVKWYQKKTESETGTALAKGAKFKPGYYYTVRVELKNTNKSYYFAGNGSSVTATVNGKNAKVVTNNSAQIISVEYTFPMCLGTVSKFEFNLAAPTANAAPHYPLLTGTGYESNNRGNNGAGLKNGIYWRNETDNKVLYPDENPKFEAGKTYSANVTAVTTTGYRVSTSYTVTVNGKAVSSQKVDNECITFKVQFTVPKAHAHTPSEWKSDAENHWKICTDTACGAITTAKETHKDANKDNKCDVCAYNISKSDNNTSNTPTASEPVASKPTTSKPTTNKTESTSSTSDNESVASANTEKESNKNNKKDDDDDDDEEDEGNPYLVWLIIGAVIILACVAVIIILLIKNKKKNNKIQN